MDCGMKLVKYLLFVFNLIFFLFALVLIGLGAAVEIKYRSLANVTGSAITVAPILVICVGVLIFFVAFFGCCGAYKENYCMITTYAIIMAILLILEIAAIVTAYVLRGKINTLLEKSFTKSIVDYQPQNAKLYDNLQTEFHCCGSYNATSWNLSKKFQDLASTEVGKAKITNPANFYVPDSCCLPNDKFKNCGLYSNRTIYEQGCLPSIEASFKKNIVAVAGVTIAVLVIQLIGIVFACCLMRTIKAQYEVV
ncbi:CD63 antigen-like [Clavelina lepadiformis]|uniref:Tetraspanin n=1 Tax=Clavelina lepadiformis TaxID=159417 RepID=A0ABP0F1J7_CLALP